MRLPSTRIRRIWQRVQIFLNPLSRVEKNKSPTPNPIMCGRVNPDIFESNDVEKSCPVSHWTISQYGGTTWKFAAPIARSMAHALEEEPWVLEWIWMASDACGPANSIWIHYVWTGKFLNPERKSCGLKKYPDTCERGINGFFQYFRRAPPSYLSGCPPSHWTVTGWLSKFHLLFIHIVLPNATKIN